MIRRATARIAARVQGLVNRPVGAVTEPAQRFTNAGVRSPRSSLRSVIIGGDHERFEFVDGRGACPHCAVSGHGMDPEGFTDTRGGLVATPAWLAALTFRGRRGWRRVRRSSSPSLAGFSWGPVELDHPLAAPTQRGGQAPPVTR